MLQKTKRSVRKGLSVVSQSVLDIVGKATCGQLSAFDRFREQANRLKVLVSIRSLGQLDSVVKYEPPLQSLTVGDIDIHSELNDVLIAWQLKKAPEVLGSGLAMLLLKFADDTADDQADAEAATTLPPSTSSSAGVEARRTAKFWAEAMNIALGRLGDASKPISADCFGEDLARQQGESLDTAFSTMMQKSRKGMQQGLRLVADDTVRLMDRLEVSCGGANGSFAVARLRSAASRLQVLAMAKSLVNPVGKHVDYEPMKALKVGGVDVHLELNRFIGAWIKQRGSTSLGESLVDFLEDFKEEEEPEPKETQEAPSPQGGGGSDGGSPMRRMIHDALRSAGGGGDAAEPLGPDCFAPAPIDEFVDGMGRAIDHMLNKRRKTMQAGLRELADVTDRLLSSQPTGCVASSGAKTMRLGTHKLRRVTRRLVVDYGTHIKYEAMKSLEVGGVACHIELNDFLAAWKLRSKEESGGAFGRLMAKMATIPGYDEL